MKISRKNALKSLFGAMISLPALGKVKDKDKKDLLGFKEEFSVAWKSSLDYTLKIFNQMPEDKFEYKYTPESFTYRTQFVHCITFTTAQICGRLNLPNPYDEKEKQNGYWKNLSKAQLETELKDFYAWVEKTVLETKPDKLAQLEGYAGDKIPVWRLFYALENHIIHHRGQAICYLRLNGITPIGYIGW
ncbi:DinB family protein [Emticicia soli]|uniref:DinB family protein n=1 Tax=Emticicia soli TaxID=2027878 RepID=A0ABW5J9Y8_9BACT